MTEENNNNDPWSKITEMTASLNFDELKAAVPEEYRSTLEPVKNMGGLLSSFANAQKALGKKTSAIPGENASPEEIADFYSKLGKPKTPDEYPLEAGEIKLPDEISKDLRKAFDSANLTKKQAEAVFKKFMEIDSNLTKAEKAERDALMGNEKKAWETTMADKREAADNAIQALLGKYPDAAKQLESVAGFAAVRKMLSDVAGLVKDDNPNPNAGSYKSASGSETPEQTIKRLKGDKDFMKKYFRSDARVTMDEHREAKKVMDTLYEALHR